MSISIKFATTSQELAAWNGFALSCPCTSFFVTTSWLDSYTAFGMQSRYLLATDSEGTVLGGAPLAIFRLGPISWLCVPHGPAVNSRARQVIPALLDAIDAYATDTRAIFVQIAPFEPAEYDTCWEEHASRNASVPYDPGLPSGAERGISRFLRAHGYQQRSYFDLLKVPQEGQIVQLKTDDFLSTFRKRTARYIRHTLRSDEVEVQKVTSVQDLAVAYGLFKENAARYGHTFRPWANFRSCIWSGIQDEYMLAFIAYYKSAPCAANVVAFGGGRGAYVAGGIKRLDYGGVRPAYLLQYVAMQETRKRGLTEYDLTSLVTGGVADFKRAFRPTYYRLSAPFSKVLRPSMLSLYLSAYPLLRKNRRHIARLIYRSKTLLRRMRHALHP